MTYKTTPGVILTSVCGKYFLVQADGSMQINETAAFYWKQLQQTASPDELAAAAAEEYEIPQSDVLKKDIRELLHSLLINRLIERSVS